MLLTYFTSKWSQQQLRRINSWPHQLQIHRLTRGRDVDTTGWTKFRTIPILNTLCTYQTMLTGLKDNLCRLLLTNDTIISIIKFFGRPQLIGLYNRHQ